MNETFYYTEIDKKTRHELFDMYVESTATALKNPAVVALIGDRALRLDEINSRLFLPNISHSTVSIPADKMPTEDSGFLPLFESDFSKPKLRLGANIFEPTPSVIASIEEAIKRTWPHQSESKTKRELRAVIRDAHKSRNKTVASLFEDQDQEDIKEGRTTEMMAQVFSRGGLLYENTNIFGYSRPLLITAPIDTEVVTTGGLALLLAHEIVHIDNTEWAYRNEDVDTQVEDELQAYSVSTAIGDTYRGSLTPEEFDDFKISELIDRARLKYVSPDAPFKTTPKLSKLMLRHGAAYDPNAN